MALELILAALAAALCAAAFAPVMIRAGLIDTPDRPRKIHTAPNPTSGGLAIGFGFALAIATLAAWPGTAWEQTLTSSTITQMAFTVALSFGALLLGLWDDLKPLGPRMKMGLMIALSIGVAVLVARVEWLRVAGSYVLHLHIALAVIGSAAWVFTLMNATNFMDGTNGLAMGSTAISLSALAVAAGLSDAPATAALALIGAGALVGFLCWNVPGGKIFAGDSGSLFAGVLGATVSLLGVTEGALSPFLMPILFFPVLADTLLTLLWRATQKRNLFDGHSDHFYQIGMRAGLKPNLVMIWYWLATLGCAAAGIAASVIRDVVPPELERLAPNGGGIIGFAGVVAGVAPKIVLTVLVLAAVQLALRVRRFSAAQALDAEQA